MRADSGDGRWARILKWVDVRLPIVTYWYREYGEFPMPRNANYLWSFGGMALVMLTLLLMTGVSLAMHYIAHVDLAFDSVERIMRDVNYGWLLRYLHMNGGSFFFLVVYVHLLRGLYYGSHKAPRELLWMLGVLLLVLMMATAFMGYVLPWGQMSFWAATVITNLFSAIPLIGDPIVTWLWGGFSIDTPTLGRFYALHYLMAIAIVAVAFMHVVALHIVGANNPVGVDPTGPRETVPFHPYFTLKDSTATLVMMTAFAAVVFFAPNILGEPDNYIPADPLKTPAHIIPEWYFWPFYAILRAVPDIWFIDAKLAGVVALFGSVIVLFFVPWLDSSPVRSARYRPFYKWFFWILIIDCLVLAWSGASAPEGMPLVLGRAATAWYFAHFLIVLPLLSRYERASRVPASIAETLGPEPTAAPVEGT